MTNDRFMQAIRTQEITRTRFVNDCLSRVNSSRFNKAQKKEIWTMQYAGTPPKQIAEHMQASQREVLRLIKNPYWPTPSLLG